MSALGYDDVTDIRSLDDLVRQHGAQAVKDAVDALDQCESRFCPSCQKFRRTFDDYCLECGADT